MTEQIITFTDKNKKNSQRGNVWRQTKYMMKNKFRIVNAKARGMTNFVIVLEQIYVSDVILVEKRTTRIRRPMWKLLRKKL